MEPLIKIWDDEFAGHYDTALSFASLTKFLQRFRGYDPRSVVEWSLYNPTQAGAGIRSAERASQLFCDVSSSRTRNTGVESSVIKSRKINAWADGQRKNDIPSLEAILRGIEDGHLSLHYARWQYYLSPQAGHPPGPMLELAYWIDREPGVEHTDEDVYEYQDTRPRFDEDDRWVGTLEIIIPPSHLELDQC